MDQVNGNINVIHDNSLESTVIIDLEELELKVCKITDHHEGQDDSRLDEDRRQATQNTPSLQQPLQPNQQGSNNNSDLNSRLRNMDDLTDIGFSLLDYSPIPTVRNTASSHALQVLKFQLQCLGR